MWQSLRTHWPEYLMESAGLGVFMLAAGLFGTLLENPESPVQQLVSDPIQRRMLMGLAMAFTAVCIIYSPWGKQSGAHINPAVTVAFWRLGVVASWDAVFYIAFQTFGGLAGVCLLVATLGDHFTKPPVSTVATVPGPQGMFVAFVAEVIIAFTTMMVVLLANNTPRFARYTGLCVGGLIVLYIVVESPLSGFSQNPARTLASALPANIWAGFWIYVSAPFIGMLGAAEVFLAICGASAVCCAKLHHEHERRCIFCAYQRTRLAKEATAPKEMRTPVDVRP